MRVASTFKLMNLSLHVKTDDALNFGFENLERAFHQCPASVTRTVHMCCGYPDKLDNNDYPKADQLAYFDLARCH